MPSSSESPAPVHRPFHALTAVGAVGHHGFELGAGVGLVFQPWLGLWGAGALWSGVFSGWLAATRRRGAGWDAALAFAGGMSAGAVALHYAMWPWRPRPLPYLVRAEGLRQHDMLAYNSILWAWGSAATGALTLETPPRLLPLAAAGAATALAFRPSARGHFDWIREQAALAPAWWNRALRAATPEAMEGTLR
jgi:hypothetical protein